MYAHACKGARCVGNTRQPLVRPQQPSSPNKSQVPLKPTQDQIPPAQASQLKEQTAGRSTRQSRGLCELGNQISGEEGEFPS